MLGFLKAKFENRVNNSGFLSLNTRTEDIVKHLLVSLTLECQTGGVVIVCVRSSINRCYRNSL